MSTRDHSRPRDSRLHTGSPGEQVLAHAQAGREIVQDFVALGNSLEWLLGQEYLRQRGNKAFLSDSAPVPFTVNNDGSLSRNAADVFFAGLLAADANGTLEDDIVVLELGIGVGLFARYFLDHVRTLCRQHQKDYYERLTYIAADRSRRMLDDVLRHGVLAEHPGRYRVRQVDALEPETLLADVGFLPSAPAFVTSAPSPPTPLPRGGEGSKGPGLRAVFLNYLLDCLPAAVLELDGEAVRQLCVRTCVAQRAARGLYRPDGGAAARAGAVERPTRSR